MMTTGYFRQVTQRKGLMLAQKPRRQIARVARLGRATKVLFGFFSRGKSPPEPSLVWIITVEEVVAKL